MRYLRLFSSRQSQSNKSRHWQRTLRRDALSATSQLSAAAPPRSTTCLQALRNRPATFLATVWAFWVFRTCFTLAVYVVFPSGRRFFRRSKAKLRALEGEAAGRPVRRLRELKGEVGVQGASLTRLERGAPLAHAPLLEDALNEGHEPVPLGHASDALGR